MEQNVDIETPMTPASGNVQRSGNGLKIITAVACAVAVCGIGFGVYGMVQSSRKDDQIASLKVKLEEYEKLDLAEESQKKEAAEQYQTISDGYIAVFHGGVGEKTYETYIYKVDNGHDNYGFTYINTTSTTKTLGSSEWETVVTGHGSFDWTDGAFDVAKENGAYSYVTVPGSDETYSIEEFQSKFIKD